MILRIKPVAALLYAASISIIVIGCVLIYKLLAPVDVLSNWRLTIPAGPHYPGETITVDSHYQKLRNVTGTAYRYIDCKNDRGTYTRYPINNSPANNSAGVSRSTGIFIKIPSDILVPTTCHISILVNYKVNALRTQPEFTTSNEFILIAKPVDAPVATQTPVTVIQRLPRIITPVDTTTSQSTSTTNTTTNTQTKTETPTQTEPERTCAVSVLGLNLLCN